MRVRLSEYELRVAALVGASRNIESTLAKAQLTYGVSPCNLWSTNIEGAAGEIAVAKALNLYFEPIVGEHSRPDVGPYEVRTNMSQRWNDTMLHPEDKDHRPYIGVLSFMPEFEIIGWIWGYDGKQQRFWRDGEKGRPAFFVPRRELYPMEHLPPVELLEEITS